MMREIIWTTLRQMIIVVVFLSFCSIAIAEESSIDIIPDSIKAENILIGGYREILVNIHTDSDDGFFVTFLPDGQAKEWITLSPNRMEISKTSPLALKIMIKLPKNIAEGLYSTTINMEFTNIIPSMLRNQRTESIDIIIDAVKKTISDIAVENVEIYGIEQGSLIDIAINLTNKGNVAEDIVINAYIGRDVFPFVIKIDPMQNIEKILNIDSSGIAPGKHNIVIEVVQSGDLISANNYQLLIEAGGQSYPDFEILKIEAPKIAYETDMVHLNSYVKNTGDSAAYAILKTQIIKGSSVIETIESKRVYVPQGKSREIPLDFAIYEEGEYLIDNAIYYGDNKTSSTAFALQILPESMKIQPLAFTIYPILFIMIIILIVVAIRYSAGKRDWQRGAK